MSNIDEIMGAVGRHGDDCIRDGDAASESFEALRELIAAALAEARHEGAVAMRDTIKHQAKINALYGVPAITLSTICALPLPTGPRQAVLLTDAAIAEAFLSRCPGHLRGEHDVRDMQARPDVMAMGRAVETAVLAANGLGVRRG